MIEIDELTYRVAGRTLLDKASTMIPTGARVGLVGRNGIGKSTLVKLLLQEISPESGEIRMPRLARIGHVAQEAPSGPTPIVEIVLAADRERADLLAEAETANDPNRIAAIHERLAGIDAHGAPARAARILAGLGFDSEAQLRPASSFSGGWRMRVALAAVLFLEPEILLLDEPTNYLDLEGTLWLEDHLARYPHTSIVVSHDRDLLNGAVDRTLHLHRGKLTLYAGGYDEFERLRREKMMLDQKRAKKQDLERKHLQSFVDRFRASATKATQAQSRLKRLEKLEPVEVDGDDAVLPIPLPAPKKMLASPLIAMEGVSVGYGERAVLSRLDLRIDGDDRIGLLGSNGNGKSTFAKLVTGRLAAMQGRLTRAPGLSVAFFAQHQIDEFEPAETAVEHVRRQMPGAKEAEVRAAAARYGLSAKRADTRVSELSGGEKARLLMGLATAHGPHVLVLDEPTNHLDVDARAALVEAIMKFPGAVIIISHDRHLIDACADRLWLVENGRVLPWQGDMDEYRKQVLKRDGRDPGKDDKGAAATMPAKKVDKGPSLSQLRKRLGELEAELDRQTKRLAGIDKLLADPLLFKTDPGKAVELRRLRQSTAGVVAHIEEEWLQISGELADVA